MKRVLILSGLLLFFSGQVFSYEYYWEPTGNNNFKIDAGSYVKRPEGEFFNVKDIKQNKVYTMQHYTEYSTADKRFNQYLGISQTCDLDEYIEQGRKICSPMSAKSAEKFETIDIKDAENYKRVMVTTSMARTEYARKQPDYWLHLYYSEDAKSRIKSAFIKEVKAAKKAKMFPKLKAPKKVFVNIEYEIIPDGSLSDAKIISSSGDKVFNDILLNSVINAEPFLVFPVSTGRTVLKGQFKYELNLISRRKFEEKFLQEFAR